jgi:uncharacterized repeat protein (TIGR03803 family)
MRYKKVSIESKAALAILAVTLLVMGTQAFAQTQKVLHNFGNGDDGQQPRAGLIFDASGNLYGTTLTGGARDGGTVFELTPKTGGGWSEKILHSFQNNGKDGYWPYASLIFDSAGNLYGTRERPLRRPHQRPRSEQNDAQARTAGQSGSKAGDGCVGRIAEAASDDPCRGAAAGRAIESGNKGASGAASQTRLGPEAGSPCAEAHSIAKAGSAAKVTPTKRTEVALENRLAKGKRGNTTRSRVPSLCVWTKFREFLRN